SIVYSFVVFNKDAKLSRFAYSEYSIDLLLSNNPFSFYRGYKDLKESKDLTAAYELHNIYLSANFLQKLFINRLFFLLTRSNMSVSGKFLGFTRRYSGRAEQLMLRLSKEDNFIVSPDSREQITAMQYLKKRFPGEVIKVRDEGVSTGSVTIAVFKFLRAQLKGCLEFTASDIVTELISITDNRGFTGVFSNAEGLIDNMLQLKYKGRIYDYYPELKDVQMLLGSKRTLKQIKNVYEIYVKQNVLPLGYKAERISSLSPATEMIRTKHPEFKVERHDLFDQLAEDHRPHLILISNVLRRCYYQESTQIIKAIRAAGNNIKEGGLVLIMNEFEKLQPSGFLRRPDSVFSHLLLQRRDNRLYIISSTRKTGDGQILDTISINRDVIDGMDLSIKYASSPVHSVDDNWEIERSLYEQIAIKGFGTEERKRFLITVINLSDKEAVLKFKYYKGLELFCVEKGLVRQISSEFFSWHGTWSSEHNPLIYIREPSTMKGAQINIMPGAFSKDKAVISIQTTPCLEVFRPEDVYRFFLEDGTELENKIWKIFKTDLRVLVNYSTGNGRWDFAERIFGTRLYRLSSRVAKTHFGKNNERFFRLGIDDQLLVSGFGQDEKDKLLVTMTGATSSFARFRVQAPRYLRIYKNNSADFERMSGRYIFQLSILDANRSIIIHDPLRDMMAGLTLDYIASEKFECQVTFGSDKEVDIVPGYEIVENLEFSDLNGV
ncbi:MAG TPA: hypothetical protein PLU24_04300, partial [Candidatus Omnitrophota bacterium]|nr:hypothetical protein [Candidatus Omnitrophota bacterium]